MSDDLTPTIEAILQRPVAISDQARAIASLIAEREAAARKEGCAWAEAVERWFIEWEMMPDWSAADPWAELHRMICWEQKVALDPAVSEDARTLRASAWREALEEAARWHDERAESTRKTLERGMSLAMRDTLDTVAYHHEQSAAAIRSLAAKEATNGQ